MRARIAASEARTKEALIVYDQTVLRALQEIDDAFKFYGAAGSTLELRLLESAATREVARLARVRFSAGEGIYLDVLEAERFDFVSRRALVVAHTKPTACRCQHLQGAGRGLGDLRADRSGLPWSHRHA